jgi:hypothetical protein
MPNIMIGPGQFLVVGADANVVTVRFPAFEIPTRYGFVSLLEPNTNMVNDEVE